MTNERNALKAGFFILAAIGLMIAVVIAIKGVGRFLEPTQAGTLSFTLQDNIGGLSRGDEVRVGGATVGTVQDVDIVERPDGETRIIVNYTLPRRFVLHRDAVAAIESTVTGVSVLNFTNLGTGELLPEGEALPGRPSALTALLESGTDIREIIRNVRSETLPKVNETIAVYKETGETATETIRHVRTKVDPIVERYNGIVDTGRGALQNIGDVFGDSKVDFRTTVANIRDITGTVRQRLPGMIDKVDGLLTSVTAAVQSTNQALEDVKQIAANTRDASAEARSVLVTNRGKIDGMITSLKTTGDNLKNASAEIRRSPWRLLYKPGAGEMANLNLYDSARQFSDGAGQLNDAALALRDALKDPDVKESDVEKLVEKLDKSFANFSEIEQVLWDQVRE